MTKYWYLDIRHAESTEQISLDLTRHLPRRLHIGSALIISDAPTKLLPVIRKRWNKIIREVETQRSSTLDRTKRRAFEREIQRMRQFSFTTKISHPHPDALVILPSQTVCDLPAFSTLYITSPLTEGQLLSLVAHASPQSVIVAYDDNDYQAMLQRYLDAS